MNKSQTKPKYSGNHGQWMPKCVLAHQNFIAISADAVKLLIDIQQQFNGYNNGDLCAAEGLMRKRGWTSKRRLFNARRELEHYSFIVVTKQGGRNGPTLYALTYINVHWCKGKHHARVTDEPSDDWAKTVEPYKKRYGNTPLKNTNAGSPLEPGRRFSSHPMNQRKDFP